MKKVKLWGVEFGSNDYVTVNAPNVKEAITKAISRRSGWPYCRVQDITEVSVIGVED